MTNQKDRKEDVLGIKELSNLQFYLGDMNNDGFVTVTDVVLLNNSLPTSSSTALIDNLMKQNFPKEYQEACELYYTDIRS